MRYRWLSVVASGGLIALMVGPALAQSTGSGGGASTPGSGTTTPSPQPPASATQPGSPSPATPSSKPMGAKNGAASSAQVTSLQKALQDKGMDPGPVDGIMGPKTMAALRAFQKAQNLPETGRLDDQTREKLGVSR